jgi:hypothetical protein
LHISKAGGGNIYLLLVLLPLIAMYTGLLALLFGHEYLIFSFEMLVDLYLLVLSVTAGFLLYSLPVSGHAIDCRGVIGYANYLRED